MGSNEASIYTALFIAASVTGIILAFFVVSLFRQHKRNIQLHREKIQAEIATLEKERKRMASDLHDEIGPVLSAVKLQINSLDTTIPGDDELIRHASRYIDDILVKIREISNDLMPTTLSRKGLYTAIADLSERINQSSGINIKTFFSDGSNLALQKEKEIHLYRIIQEIVHNCIKHSGASNIEISINQANGLLLLGIKDNGKGFEYAKIIKDNDGLGLKNILSRVELMQGVMFLDTEPSRGVHYSIEIPLT